MVLIMFSLDSITLDKEKEITMDKIQSKILNKINKIIIYLN